MLKETFISKLSPNRQLLANILLEKDWFNNTELSIQKQLLNLPDDFEGFLYDLSQRQDRIGTVQVKKLAKLSLGEYLITPTFEVYSTDTRKTYKKEFVSWKMGRVPGLKGLLLIEKDGQITHFVTIETDKFAFGKVTHDTIGGIFQYTKEEIADLPSQVHKIVKDKLGLPELKIQKFIDLGHIQSDNGLTVNYPGIFAAIIDAKDSKSLSEIQSLNTSGQTKSYRIDIIPIEQLEMYINRIDDAFFLSIIARLLAKGIITL